MSYESNIVKKPWGYEYLVYKNEHVGLWFLNIESGQSTSMHCHPNKTTGLMVVSGDAEVSFLSDKLQLGAFEKVMIRKGLFHSTRAPSGNLRLFEIETPVDKHDLVRLEDSYGREGKPYEGDTHEVPKKSACLWITDPQYGGTIEYVFANTKIVVSNVQSIDDLVRIVGTTNAMFLKGGIVTDYGVNVAGPGDIVSSDVIRKLVKVFPQVTEDTVILTVGSI